MIDVFKLFEEAKKYDHPFLISLMYLNDECIKERKKSKRKGE